MTVGPAELAELLATIERAEPRCGTVRVIAVDGGAASGKTTLAAELAATLTSVSVVHTDDLLAGWDDQFTFWPRLRADILGPIAQGRSGRLRPYDWASGRFGDDEVEVPVTRNLIVEGVSAVEACGEWLALGILITAAREERERRWRDRDGELSAEAIRWLDREDGYFARLNAEQLNIGDGLSLRHPPTRPADPTRLAERQQRGGIPGR
jgi:hypothetical protein